MSLGSEGGGVPAVMNVTPTGGTGYNNGGWGGDWGAWIILFLVFSMFGWGGMGGFGFGGFGGMGGAYPVESILQRSLDTQTIIGKLDGVTQGLCDGFYAQSNAINGLGMNMMQGFHGVDNAVCNLGYQTQQGFNATQVALMQGFNAAQAQAADCCCKTQTNIMQLGNQVERGFCQSNYNDQANTTAIIQNAHNDTDRVLAKLDAMEMSRKDETIAALRSQVDALNLAQSQANQNNYLVNQLRPCPTPAYITCNPWAGSGYGGCGYSGGCGCNSGCGC